MDNLYEELARARVQFNSLKEDGGYDAMDECCQLEIKIDCIEAKLLSLQYRTVVGHLYSDLIVARIQEKGVK